MKLNRDERVYFVLFIYLCPASTHRGMREEQWLMGGRKYNYYGQDHRADCTDLGARGVGWAGTELQCGLGGPGMMVSSTGSNEGRGSVAASIKAEHPT